MTILHIILILTKNPQKEVKLSFKIVLYTFGNREKRRQEDGGKPPLVTGGEILTYIVDIRDYITEDPKNIYPEKTGLFEEVQNWVMKNGGEEAVYKILSDILGILRRLLLSAKLKGELTEFKTLQFGISCGGGLQRSVAVAEKVYAVLKTIEPFEVMLYHSEIMKNLQLPIPPR